MKYVESKELDRLAQKVLKSNKSLDANKGCRIKFLIRKSGSSPYLGVCKKTSPLVKFLTGYDYIIEVWEGFWNKSNKKQKKALLLHELLHIQASVDSKGNQRWKIRKHDVEEFLKVIKKYGGWLSDRKEFLKLLKKGIKKNEDRLEQSSRRENDAHIRQRVRI